MSENVTTKLKAGYILEFDYLLPSKFRTFADCICQAIYESIYF
ncbi:hypothetical protein SAMN05444394_2826 [Algoriphagus halophilus]|uniref:Uncharacterized protein n=1 Tax=Algoriphagus halophilus TaxID=226505 RepID=A0A1N6FYI6_9BACT|nr:hypothetical protein SAMN05444394_2826 [Algoriphagus halophilus]